MPTESSGQRQLRPGYVGPVRLLTAADAQDSAVAAATNLSHAGLSAGDRLAVVTPEYASGIDVPLAQADVLGVLLGALRLGVIPVLLHPLLTEVERHFILNDAQVTADPILPEQLAAWTRPAPGSPAELSEFPLTRPMHYTSGTTGSPKGVIAQLSEREAFQWWTDEIGHWQFDSADRTLVHSPLCHSAPLRFAIGTLLAGGTVVLPGRFGVATTIAAMREAAPTTAFLVPSQAALLLAAELPRSTYRLLAHAGSACPPEVKRGLHAWAGADRVWEFYGSTEGQFTSCRGTEWEARPGTVGRARPGRDLDIDSAGLVWCTPPTFARFEYWNDPVKTAAAWRSTAGGRAFTVGDLGRLDDDGYLYLEGRREDLIISGGVNVYPAEVESVISTHPLVQDVVVFAVPDSRWGQRVTCAVVTSASADELTAWSRQRLAAYKLPKEWIVVETLPRNSMGKVRRSTLSRELGLTES